MCNLLENVRYISYSHSPKAVMSERIATNPIAAALSKRNVSYSLDDGIRLSV